MSNLTAPCAPLHTAVISYFFMKTFGESVRVEFQLHRWNLSDHSPSETDAILDVLVKIFNQMRSWCENTGLILITPLSPLPIDYPWNTLKLDQWKIGMNNISLIRQPFYKSQWTHTSTKQSRLQVRATSFKERIIPSIASFGQSVPSLHVLTVNGNFKRSICSWLIWIREKSEIITLIKRGLSGYLEQSIKEEVVVIKAETDKPIAAVWPVSKRWQIIQN